MRRTAKTVTQTHREFPGRAVIAGLVVGDVSATSSGWRPGTALVALSVVEQRLDAVRAGASVTEIAPRVGGVAAVGASWPGQYRSGEIVTTPSPGAGRAGGLATSS